MVLSRVLSKRAVSVSTLARSLMTRGSPHRISALAASKRSVAGFTASNGRISDTPTAHAFRFLASGASSRVVHVPGGESSLSPHIDHPGQLVVVDFFATWCPPCKMISPVLDAMSVAQEDKVFLKVDVDDCPGIAAERGIQAMPTFQFYRDGEKVGELVGADRNRLEEMIAKL